MIPYGRHYIDEDDIRAVVEVLRHGALTQGPEIAAFESAVAGYVGAKYAVAVSSGTAALHLACLAGGVGKDDNLITTPNTFVASANCALYVGARPHFADIDNDTLNVDPQRLADRCAELKTVKAIVPVHFAGLPCDMPAIGAIAKKYGAVVIEDASHALGAVYTDGGKVGNCRHSDMTIFSFHPVKHIAAGEGGMITTNREDIYRRLLRYRSHGINKGDDPLLETAQAYENGEFNRWYYEMQEVGFNYRITGLQSALALSQLGKLERFLARRRELVAAYDAVFPGMRHLKPTQLAGRNQSAHHLYVVRIDYEALGMSRTKLMAALADSQIGSQVHYIPVHLHPCYRRLGFKANSYPIAERYYREALSLPLFYTLTDDEQRHVIQHVKSLVS
jgi:perosamine synthetase